MLDGGVKQLDDDDDVVSLFFVCSASGWVFEPGSWRQTGRIKKKELVRVTMALYGLGCVDLSAHRSEILALAPAAFRP